VILKFCILLADPPKTNYRAKIYKARKLLGSKAMVVNVDERKDIRVFKMHF